MGQHPLGNRSLFRHGKSRLGHLDIKTAKLIPGKTIQRTGRIGEAVFVERFGHLAGHGRQSGEQPAIFEQQISELTLTARRCGLIGVGTTRSPRFINANREAFHSLLQKLRPSSNRSLTAAPRGRAWSSAVPCDSDHCVPNGLFAFVTFDAGQGAILFGLGDERVAMRALEFHRQPHVLRFGAEIRDPKPQRIGAELFDHVQRIDTVALRLRHRLAVAVENLRMDVHLGEGNFSHVVKPASTIRATHSVMISREVISVLVG